MSAVLRARALTAEAFAPFGEVLTSGADRARFDDVLFSGRPAARPHLDIALVSPRSLPLRADLMERHVFSSQSFVPISVASYLLFVAPAGPPEPDLSRAALFVARGDQVITYRVGTWHFPVTPLGAAGRFATLTWRADDEDDTEFHQLTTPVELLDGDA